MRFKGTAALFILLVILGGFVYFTEIRGKEERQKQEEAKTKVIDVDEKDITEISLIYPDRTITGVKKGDKQWEITSPAGFEADPDAWDQLASSLTGVRREGDFSENAQDLSPFGLKEPSIKVIGKLKDGKSVEISFGSENPKKTGKYAKLGDSNEVILTAVHLASSFTKTLSDLRNKKLLHFESNEVDGVRIEGGTTQVDLQKSGDDWQLKKPIEAKADSSEVTSFVNSISLARGSFPDPSVDAKKAGLDPPDIRITLHDAKAKSDHVLLIGKTAEKDKYYARDISRDAIFIIEKEIPENVRRPVFAWRDKAITSVDAEKIDRIEIQRGSENLTLLKAGLDWKFPDDKKLIAERVLGMVNTLEFERAKDIIDNPKSLSSYGLDQPRVVAVFKQGSTEIARLAFGVDSKTPEGVYLKTGANPAVMVVSKDAFDKFSHKTDDLLDKSAEAPPQK